MKVFVGWSVLLLLGIPAHQLDAQTIVRVESNGVRVSGAEVTAWDDLGRVAFARTDGLGIAHLAPLRPIAPSAFLLVRRLGFAPVRIAYPDRDSMSVSLSTVPTSLPALALDVSPLRCRSRAPWQVWRPRPSEAPNDRVADSLWRLAAARYAIGAVRLRAERIGGMAGEMVTREQRGYGDGSPIPEDTSANHLAIHGEFGATTPPPYAEYDRHLNISGEYWRWRYASLTTIAAEHFVTESFHQRHSFVVLGTSASATVIGFCPRDYSDAEIEGELQITPDGVLRSARWSFRVPHDDEDAGGESTFTSVAFEGRSYLLAIRGSSWVRATPTLYNQTRFEVSSWRLSRWTR
ncbi:MAG: hypothetical protein M3Z05_14500 [Gemmatimonadota bacterium]|nr:hypothetical protein [Gemmatimonadota bacterium]